MIDPRRAYISALSAVGSLIGLVAIPRGEVRAAEQARIATRARIDTADNVKRIADAQAGQQLQAERADRGPAVLVRPRRLHRLGR
jgi:hypothetical protein